MASTSNDYNYYVNYDASTQTGDNPLNCNTPTANYNDWTYDYAHNFVNFPSTTNNSATGSFQIDLEVTSTESDIITNGTNYVWGCFAVDIDPTIGQPFQLYNIGTYEGNLYITDSDITGIKSIFNNTQIKIYPNPFNNQLIIENKSQMPITKVSVNDLLGREVMTLTPEILRTITLDTHNFDNGIYFIKVYNNNDSYSVKLIKE
jgi:hypothetical protein